MNQKLNNLQKLLSCFDKQSKLKLALMLFLSILGSILEVFGIAILLPIIGILANQKDISESLDDYLWFDLNSYTDKELILLFLLIFIIFSIIKTLILSYVTWFKTNNAFKFGVDFSYKIFQNYLDIEYGKYLKRNSSELIRNIQAEAPKVIQNILIPILTIFTEIFLLLGITVILLLIEPTGLILSGLLLTIITYIYLKVTRKRLIFWGQKRLGDDSSSIKFIQQGVHGLKDIRIFKIENWILSNFLYHSKRSANFLAKINFLNLVLRYWFELFTIICISFAFFFYFIIQELEVSQVNFILGVLLVSIFKLMPSFNKISSSLQQVVSQLPGLDLILKEINKENQIIRKKNKKIGERENIIKFEKKISIQNLSFSYENKNDQAVIKNINFEILKGEKFGILGKSGAGKSSLVDLITGIHKPLKGSILSDQIDIQANLDSWFSKIGYVPQMTYLFDDTIKNNIAIGSETNNINENLLKEVIKKTELENLVNSLPKDLDTFIGERGQRLSGGEKQRIGIARALYRKPEILVLDESTSSLDNETEKKIMNIIDKLAGDLTIVIVSHRKNTVKNCNRVIYLDNGKIKFEGKVSEYD